MYSSAWTILIHSSAAGVGSIWTNCEYKSFAVKFSTIAVSLAGRSGWPGVVWCSRQISSYRNPVFEVFGDGLLLFIFSSLDRLSGAFLTQRKPMASLAKH